MWVYDDEKWIQQGETLLIDKFQYYEQELEETRYYSKCLSGSSYLPINDMSNIYESLTYYNPKNWYIGHTASNYAIGPIPSNFPTPINQYSEDEYYNKFNSEYALSVKNLFTPDKIIKDAIKNYIYVDVATTAKIINLYDTEINRKIDNVRLLEGHKVLVKDQTSSVVLPNSTDPNIYFGCEYRIVETIGTNTEYEIYNSENGIYTYINNRLVKDDILDNYNNTSKFSVNVKLGDINSYKQFHLSRLLNGLFPVNGDPMLFKEKKNWVVRNVVDYNNVLDINYYDIIKHGTQSYTHGDIDYTIPERLISVGEFGVIINNQSGISNIIYNKYKKNLRSISQTDKFYWIVGDGGLILKVRKHDFNIEKIESNVDTKLKSISFFNNLNGVIVGEYNTILITANGGLKWVKIEIDSFRNYSYNSVIFKQLNSFYVGGNNGVFIHFKRDVNDWKAYKRRISLFIDAEEDFPLVDNINTIFNTTIYGWNPTYSIGTYSTTNPKDLLFLTTDNNKIIIHDLNNSIPHKNEFFYLSFENEDYSNIINIMNRGTSSVFYMTATDKYSENPGIFSFDINNFTTIGEGNIYSNIISSTFSAEFVSDYYPNKLLDYDDILYVCGDNSILEFATYSTALNFQEIDDEFGDDLKSKLLFTDYDIASKLNFFDDEGNYRLPNTVEAIIGQTPGSYVYFTPIVYASATPSFITKTETNWWEYTKDSNSTFQYYSNDVMTDSVRVKYSGTFSYNINNIININSITNLSSDILELAPSILDEGHSRFNGYSMTPISEPINIYDLYLYDYLMIIRYDINQFSLQIGDVIRLESDNVNGNFLINKIANFGTYSYAYTFSEFNDSVIKSIIDSTSVTITNLNLYSDESNLVNNFNLHPISIGYEMENSFSDVFDITPKFNNLTSYYNLATNIVTNTATHSSVYQDSFLRFGYKPTYNLLDYMEYLNESDINPKFYANKEYLAMPIYANIPISESPLNECYIDTGIDNNNKLVFGVGLKFEWESIFLNTFVNITLYDSITNQVSEKMLVTKKYQDTTTGYYVIEFNKSIKYDNLAILTFITIASRRTLLEISDDLATLNNIHRNINTHEYIGGTTESLQLWNANYQTYEKELKSKFNTDSYCKILLSDYDTRISLSGIIYIDYKNELALNICNLEEKVSINIINTSDFGGKLCISCSNKHGLSSRNGIILNFLGGIGSSEELNPQYFGYHVVETVINEFNFTVNLPYGNNILLGDDFGIAEYIKNDPFFNYQPIDLIDVGVDKRGKIAIELDETNTTLVDNVYSLINIDYDKLRFRLVDNLDIERLTINYPWILEAELSGAIIGFDNNGLVWYGGKWLCGRWFGGTWVSGTWLSGDWYNGTWKSNVIKDNFISVEYNDNYSDIENSLWYGGRWYSGNWQNGTWYDGRWYSGEWFNGDWYSGIWDDGTWYNGIFSGGIWVNGTWKLGRLNNDSGSTYWLNGKWEGGDFENGIWYNGTFDSINGESRFGTRSYSSRNAVWYSGNWQNGSFHSKLNIVDNKYDVAINHKYSIWKTGKWYNGEFYGGNTHNIDFKSGTWHGGIAEYINIIGMSTENYFVLDGIYPFNNGDIIHIIDNNIGGSYSYYGSNSSPIEYTITNCEIDEANNSTNIYVNFDIIDDVEEASNLNIFLVSIFRNCNWKSGIWFNGIYEKGLFEGGIWYDGIFKANWM